MNRFWWSCDKCNWELSEKVSGAFGQPTEEDVRWCDCQPPIEYTPRYGKDTSQ